MNHDFSFLLNKRVRVYDAAPKPPAHHKRKVEAWENSNYEGVISEVREYDGSPCITINFKNMYGSGGQIVASFNRTVSVQLVGHGKLWDGKRNYDVDLTQEVQS